MKVPLAGADQDRLIRDRWWRMGGRRNHWVTGRLPRRVSAPPWEPSRMAPRESKREQERRAWVAQREGFKDESEAYEQRLARQRPGIRLEMGGPTRRSRPLKGAAWATVISSQVQPRPGWSWEGRRAGGRNMVETGGDAAAICLIGSRVSAGRWRQGWDSNPWTRCHVNGFRGRRPPYAPIRWERPCPA